MRKEYIPAIILYIISAFLYIATAVCIFMHSHHWATFLLLGAAVMLFASSRLVNVGKKLREEEEKLENTNEYDE